MKAKFKGNTDEDLNELQKKFADLEKEVKLLKSSSGEEKGEELDKKKYERLVSEYRNFKKQNVRHWRFNSAGDFPKFGKYKTLHAFTQSVIIMQF